jgi:integrase
MLGTGWDASESAAILAAVCNVKELVDSRHCSLAEAKTLWKAREGAPAASTRPVADQGWPLVVEEFIASRANRRGTTLRDLKCHMRRTLQTLDQKPRPRDGGQLMRAYAAQHFSRCRAGNSGRVTQLNNVAGLLRFAVRSFGYDQQWLPLDREQTRELIGVDDRPTEDTLTPPLLPNDLANLLDAMRADERTGLMLATALVGLYGLRPAELGAMVVTDGDLHIRSTVKRNAKTLGKKLKPPRLVQPLDLPGRDGEGQRILDLWQSGLVKLPSALLKRINEIEEKGWKPVGDEFRQQLERYKPWQSLVAKYPGLTPYSLRHGWAWRAHKGYDRPMSIRDAAALMGHSPNVHHNTYGRWTDEAGLKDAVAKLKPAPTTEGLGSTPMTTLDITDQSA